MRTRREAGVTLMELMIAVTLVSLISVGILYAMRAGLMAMEKTNTRLMANRRVLGAQRILEQQIAGFMPVVALCTATGGPPAEIRFFQGEISTMRFVSMYSIQEASRGRPQVLEFQVIPGEEGKGVRLIVNETPYFGPLAAGASCFGMAQDPVLGIALPRFGPVEPSPNSFVLADKLAYCRFVYRQRPDPPLAEVWLPRWIRNDEWPSAIRVELAPLEAQPGRVPLLPLTVPVRSTRNPQYAYTQW